MKIKEKITYEEICGSQFQIKLYEDAENGKAALTHYLHNYQHGATNFNKKKAVEHFAHALKYKFPDENITLKVAEVALQDYLFNYRNVAPFSPPVNPKFTFIDLFAGVGGFRIAMQNIGGKCIFTSEWDEKAKITYEANYGEVPFGDITKIETKKYIPKDFDVLCAGFPCQAFSIAGYQKGFDDERGNLFFEIEKILESHRPKVALLENVKNLAAHDKGNTFKVIKEILEKKLGYKVFHKVMNSMEYANIPQNRERIFIVALDPLQVPAYKDFAFPEKIKLTKNIHDIIDEKKQDDIYYYSPNHAYFPKLDAEIYSKDTIYQWRRIYVRENKSNVCPTLTANMGAGGHNVPLIRDNYGIRKLTPRECFGFQGYPQKFILPVIANSKLYMQAGNTVTLPLVERITKKILEIL
ncbi:MAG TPA: DNA cytosine methyltransferase [Clostridiales bacterium]|nr:DNA cytosine methyltransferase [Clostridiales bacterium]